MIVYLGPLLEGGLGFADTCGRCWGGFRGFLGLVVGFRVRGTGLYSENCLKAGFGKDHGNEHMR